MIDVNVETDKINEKLGKLEKKFAQLIKTSEKASKMTSEKHQKLQNEVIRTRFLFLRSYVISTTNIREQGTINKYYIHMKHLQHIYIYTACTSFRKYFVSPYDHNVTFFIISVYAHCVVIFDLLFAILLDLRHRRNDKKT